MLEEPRELLDLALLPLKPPEPPPTAEEPLDAPPPPPPRLEELALGLAPPPPRLVELALGPAPPPPRPDELAPAPPPRPDEVALGPAPAPPRLPAPLCWREPVWRLLLPRASPRADPPYLFAVPLLE
jgi:hypothetical protein